MQDRYARYLLFFAAAAVIAGPAMSAPVRCRVIAGDKLSAASGGSNAICAEIERAVAALAPNARYTAEVKVVSPSRLSARLVVNGRTLPEQKFAVMDRELGRGPIQRFAQSLASEIAKASKR